MSQLFGLELDKIIDGALTEAGGLDPRGGTLVKVTSGAREAGSLTSGKEASEQRFPFRGMVSKVHKGPIPGTIVQAGDREVLILGASLPASVVPELNDKVEVEGASYTILLVPARDPARATYTCTVR